MNAASQMQSDLSFSTIPSTRTYIENGASWAGSERTTTLIELPGLVAWVHSAPAGRSQAGGDVHYVSTCPGGVVSHVALADVSGHGQAVVLLADKLRELMEEYLPALGERKLMRDLNEAVREGIQGVDYATMVAVTWDSESGLLVLNNAGHPPACALCVDRDEWTWLKMQRESELGQLIGVPLGLLPGVDYDATVFNPGVGDLVVLYSDGVCEAASPAGDYLGRDGLMDLMRQLDSSSAETFGNQLRSALRDFCGGVELTDDETIIVLQRVPTEQVN